VTIHRQLGTPDARAAEVAALQAEVARLADSLAQANKQVDQLMEGHSGGGSNADEQGYVMDGSTSRGTSIQAASMSSVLSAWPGQLLIAFNMFTVGLLLIVLRRAPGRHKSSLHIS
jgi:hypothetical protein